MRVDYNEYALCDGGACRLRQAVLGFLHDIFFFGVLGHMQPDIHKELLEWLEKVTWLLTILLVMGEYFYSGWRYGEDSQSDA